MSNRIDHAQFLINLAMVIQIGKFLTSIEISVTSNRRKGFLFSIVENVKFVHLQNERFQANHSALKLHPLFPK